MLSTRPLALDDGPATYAYTRTPAKGLLKSRGALQENTTTVLRGPKILNTGKGKAVALRTPTQNRHSARKNGNAFQTAKKLTTVISTKPLGDKTPFPNRQQALQTPAPQTAKLAKLQLSLHDDLDDGELAMGIGKTPGNLLLPSARRKSMRLPRSASKKFRTPDGQGRHWDVSDGDVRLEVDEDTEDGVTEEPDYEEVEYMPPKVPEQPYEPLFPLPDYKTVGKTLLDLAYVGLRDDSAERFYAADIETVVDIKTLLEESEVKLELRDIPEDDPFRRSPTPTRPSLRPRPSSQASTHISTHTNKPTAPTLQRTTTLPAKPPPATRSNPRVTSGSTIGATQTTITTNTRVTRSTSARNAVQTTQPEPQTQTNPPRVATRATTTTTGRSVAAPVATVTRSTRSTAPATRPTTLARTSSRATDSSRAPSRTEASSRAPSRTEARVPSRTDSRVPSRAPSRTETSSRAPSRTDSRVPSRASTRAPSRTDSRVPSRTSTRAPSRASTRASAAASTVPPPNPTFDDEQEEDDDLLGAGLQGGDGLDDFEFEI